MAQPDQASAARPSRDPKVAKALRHNIRAALSDLHQDVRFLTFADPIFAKRVKQLGVPSDLIATGSTDMNVPEPEVGAESRTAISKVMPKRRSGAAALKPLRHKVISNATAAAAQVQFARQLDDSLDVELASMGVDLDAILAKLRDS